jgi:hypothetical protein
LVAHSSLTGSDLHESKGVSTAAANTLYVADGAGSGSWQKIASGQINTSSIFNANETYLSVTIPDVSTADTVYVVVPFAGTLTKVWTVLDDAITVADATVTVRDHNGNSAGTITVAYSGSAAGDIDSLVPASNNTFTEGQRVRIQTDGASTTAALLTVSLVFTITG